MAQMAKSTEDFELFGGSPLAWHAHNKELRSSGSQDYELCGKSAGLRSTEN